MAQQRNSLLTLVVATLPLCLPRRQVRYGIPKHALIPRCLASNTFVPLGTQTSVAYVDFSPASAAPSIMVRLRRVKLAGTPLGATVVQRPRRRCNVSTREPHLHTYTHTLTRLYMCTESEVDCLLLLLLLPDTVVTPQLQQLHLQHHPLRQRPHSGLCCRHLRLHLQARPQCSQ